MEKREWLLLNYTLSKEPSRIRVSIWRRLKKCGSVNIGQSMWLLPLSNENIDIFSEISKDIAQNSGKYYIMKSNFISTSNTEDITQIFKKARDEEYKEFLGKCEDFFDEIKKETKKNNFSFAEMEENEQEYEKLVDWYKKIALRDFFEASLKIPSEEALKKCKKMLDDFSNKIYALND